MTAQSLKQALLGLAFTASLFGAPISATAHTLDTCAPQVTILTPQSPPNSDSARSFISQAALFLDRVPETELRKAVDGIEPGHAVLATYMFSGPDTRWRLKSPLSYRENSSQNVLSLPEQKHFLVPSAQTRPYGTIVVTGTDNGPGSLINPSMVAHLADGRAIVMEPHDLDADCHIDLQHVETAFLESVAYYFDHHHHDETHDGLRSHESGKYNDQAEFRARDTYFMPARKIPEFDAHRP